MPDHSDKPAVGPLSAVRVTKCLCAHSSCTDYWLTGVGKFVQGSGFEKDEAELIAGLLNARLDPTGKVEAGRVERDDDPIDVQEIDGRHDVDADDDAKILAYEDAHSTALDLGYPSLTEALEDLDRLKSSRPQPSGETLQSLAQAFEDAMEGSHGAWAVSGETDPTAPVETLGETVSPEGLRARANMVRDKLNDSGSCARHLELAADEIERLLAPQPDTGLVEAGGVERWTDVVAPELLTDDELNAAWKAPGGQGEFRRDWDDKPHRLIYRLLGHIAALSDLLDAEGSTNA